MKMATLGMGQCVAAGHRVETRSSIADTQMKHFMAQAERLENLSLNLRDRLQPISRTEAQDSMCGIGQPEECWPDYFEQLRSISRTMDRVADRLDDIYSRLEI